MSELSTIKVVYKPGKYEMVINESDFNAEIHEKIGEEKSNVKQSKKKNTEEDLKALIGEE